MQTDKKSQFRSLEKALHVIKIHRSRQSEEQQQLFVNTHEFNVRFSLFMFRLKQFLHSRLAKWNETRT